MNLEKTSLNSLQKATNWVVLNYKKVIIISGVVFLVGGFFLTYKFYRDSLEQSAHASFVSCVNVLDAKGQVDGTPFRSEQEKWTKVAEVFEEGYKKNKSASIAPMFLAFKAEALINLGKINESIELLKKVVSLLSEGALKDSYILKLALLQIDSGNEALLSDGILKLVMLSEKDKSPVNDIALFRLGEYYLIKQDIVAAKKYLNILVLNYGNKKENTSIWAKKGLEKLSLISGDKSKQIEAEID